MAKPSAKKGDRPRPTLTLAKPPKRPRQLRNIKGAKANPNKVENMAAALERDRLAKLAGIERRAVLVQRGLDELRARFPQTFDPTKPPVPLAIGTKHTIRKLLGVPHRVAEDLIAGWCGRQNYIAAIAAGGLRYHLDGTPAGEISEEHRVGAVELLAKRKERRRQARERRQQNREAAAA